MPRRGSVFVWVKFDWHCILGVHIRARRIFFFLMRKFVPFAGLTA